MSSTFAPWVSANAPAVAASSATQNAVESTRATPGRFYGRLRRFMRSRSAGQTGARARADGIASDASAARPEDGNDKRCLGWVLSDVPAEEELPGRPHEEDHGENAEG